MDYNALGASKKGSKIPRHKEHNAPGTDKNPFGKRPSKEELIARLKAKVEKFPERASSCKTMPCIELVGRV